MNLFLTEIEMQEGERVHHPTFYGKHVFVINIWVR